MDKNLHQMKPIISSIQSLAFGIRCSPTPLIAQKFKNWFDKLLTSVHTCDTIRCHNRFQLKFVRVYLWNVAFLWVLLGCTGQKRQYYKFFFLSCRLSCSFSTLFSTFFFFLPALSEGDSGWGRAFICTTFPCYSILHR